MFCGPRESTIAPAEQLETLTSGSSCSAEPSLAARTRKWVGRVFLALRRFACVEDPLFHCNVYQCGRFVDFDTRKCFFKYSVDQIRVEV